MPTPRPAGGKANAAAAVAAAQAKAPPRPPQPEDNPGYAPLTRVLLTVRDLVAEYGAWREAATVYELPAAEDSGLGYFSFLIDQVGGSGQEQVTDAGLYRLQLIWRCVRQLLLVCFGDAGMHATCIMAAPAWH